jgi:hypothetical protein
MGSLESRIQELEARVQVLIQLSGLEPEYLRFVDDQELLQIYRGVVQTLKKPIYHLTLDQITKFIPFFMGISELEYARIEVMTGYDRPWSPFYRLCVQMMTFLRQDQDMTDPRIRGLYALLDKGRQAMGQALIQYLQHQENPPFQALLQDLPQKPVKKD